MTQEQNYNNQLNNQAIPQNDSFSDKNVVRNEESVVKEEPVKKGNKKLLVIAVVVITLFFCIPSIFAGYLILSGVKVAQDVNKNTQVKAFMRNVELGIEEYYIDNYYYPDSLKDIEVVVVREASSDFDSYQLSENEIVVDGYTVVYEKLPSEEFRLYTTLKNGESFEINSDRGSY